MSFVTCSRAFAEPLILDFSISLHCFLCARMAVFRTVCAMWMRARQATRRRIPGPVNFKVCFLGFVYLALFALLTVLAVPGLCGSENLEVCLGVWVRGSGSGRSLSKRLGLGMEGLVLEGLGLVGLGPSVRVCRVWV